MLYKIIQTIFCSCLLIMMSPINAAMQQAAMIKVGVIIPMEHTALQEIVSGFTETLKKNYSGKIDFKITNAQGDANLQRSIIQQMHDQQYDLVVPIGTSAAQMTLAIIHNKPVISLAADISEQQRQQLQPCNIGVVHDEISAEQSLAFVHAVYPKVTQLLLIHSASDKIFPEVAKVVQTAKRFNLTIKPLMVQSLPDLYRAVQMLPNNTQAILILKDSQIVSGIAILVKAAKERKIPLITSDQGSVQDGAGLALGVHERQIGSDGATLAVQVLKGMPVCKLPIMQMKQLTVFINTHSLPATQLPRIYYITKQFNYTVETVNKLSIKKVN